MDAVGKRCPYGAVHIGPDSGQCFYREAGKKASAFAEDGTYIETKEPLRLPGFEKAIGFAVQKALEDWRDEALEGALHAPPLSGFIHN